jgi:preprotein translocase subunit SecD
MVVVYGLFGVFASVAVAINVAMIFGVLSLLNATLTLPGHRHRATIGIAVDSNVLIYDASAKRCAPRTPITAIDAGSRGRRPSRPTSHLHRGGCAFFIGTGVCWFRGDARHRDHRPSSLHSPSQLMVAWWVR